MAPILPASTSARLASYPSASFSAGTPVVVQVPGHPACEHARHAHGPVAALKQVNTQRGVTFGGEPAADVSDVVVQPGGLMNDHHPRKRAGAIGESQIRPAQRFAPHDPQSPLLAPDPPGYRPGTGM